MRTFFPLPALLLVSLGAAAPEPAPQVLDDRLAMAALADAALRGDARGLEQARERLGTEDSARRHYETALAEWFLSQSIAANPAEALAAARRAEQELEAAQRLDPTFAAAPALLTRVYYSIFNYGALDPKQAFTKMSDLQHRALELSPDGALPVLVDAIANYYAPPAAGGNRARGLARFYEAIGRLEQSAPEDPEAALWLPVAWSWLGGAYISEGEMLPARQALERALAVRPDYALVRNALLPMTEVVDPGSLPDLSRAAWAELASDPAGDGRMPRLPDLRRVSTFSDRAAGRVYFRFELEAPADPDRFGLNLAVDTDGDQATGAHWWAGNTAFTYDRLVTLWLARGTDGRFRGAAGVGDAAGVAQGRFLDVARGVTFAVVEGNRVIVIGIPRSSLGSGERFRAVGTIGSNTTWNDTAPDKGSGALDLAP